MSDWRKLVSEIENPPTRTQNTQSRWCMPLGGLLSILSMSNSALTVTYQRALQTRRLRG
jgi:hypothetical protein